MLTKFEQRAVVLILTSCTKDGSVEFRSGVELKCRSILDAQGKAQLLPYLHISLVPHPYPHLHLHPSWHAHTHPLKGAGNHRVGEAAAEVAVAEAAAAVVVTVAASVVVAAVALLFFAKGAGRRWEQQEGTSAKGAAAKQTQGSNPKKSSLPCIIHAERRAAPIYPTPNTQQHAPTKNKEPAGNCNCA
jgi:hypothetical protein